MKFREVERILRKNGFSQIRQNGSHRHYKGIVGRKTRHVTLSGRPSEDIPKGTLGAIRRQSGLSLR